MIIAQDVGLVLFHLDSVWLDGKPSTNGRIAKEKQYPGSEVSLLMRSFHGDESSRISEEYETFRGQDRVAPVDSIKPAPK